MSYGHAQAYHRTYCDQEKIDRLDSLDHTVLQYYKNKYRLILSYLSPSTDYGNIFSLLQILAWQSTMASAVSHKNERFQSVRGSRILHPNCHLQRRTPAIFGQLILDVQRNLIRTLANDSYALIDITGFVTQIHNVTGHCVCRRICFL